MFIDKEKAYDKVDHVILLDKLWKAGFKGIPYVWLKSYLLNRRQLVRIGSSINAEGTLMYGVLQGSVLGPILFLIYSNDRLYMRVDSMNKLLHSEMTALLYSDTDLDLAIQLD